MLTGRSAFAGETLSDTIANTLGQDPEWKALPSFTSVRLREVIRRCLQKDEQQRLSDISYASIQIDQAVVTRSGWRSKAGVALAAAGVVLAIVIGARWLVSGQASTSAKHSPVTILIADFENRKRLDVRPHPDQRHLWRSPA
jgi:hypothetical protein